MPTALCSGHCSLYRSAYLLSKRQWTKRPGRTRTPHISCRQNNSALLFQHKGTCSSAEERFQVRRGDLAVIRASAETETEQELQIEGIDKNYCDDFVCTSSPQVEQNVKALARDTIRLSTWTSSLFRKDVQYRDAFLSFKGINKYKRLVFIKDVVGNPKVLVTKLRMLDRGRACVEWRLRGAVAVFPIDINFESEFELDLITGRVYLHCEKWDLSRLSLPAKLAFNASRAAWSLGVRIANTKEDSSSFFQQFSKGEENQSNITVDPMDPTKFFQNDDDPTKDLFSIGAIVAFIWLIYSAYSEIAKLK